MDAETQRAYNDMETTDKARKNQGYRCAHILERLVQQGLIEGAVLREAKAELARFNSLTAELDAVLIELSALTKDL